MTDAPDAVRGRREKRQRSRLVQVRCTPTEYARFSVGAEDLGLSIGAYVRMRCNGTAGERAIRRPPVEHAALAQLLALLGRAASNLNQVARIGNTTGDLPAGADDAVQAVKRAADEILLRLGRGAA